MLTRDIAKTHAKPARKLNGTLYGDIVSVSRVVWQSENWILLGGTWNAVNNLFSGTWIEMKTVSGLTPSNPIKFVAWPDPEPPNTSTETPGVDGPFMVGAPHGSVWYAIASTLSDESIRAGTPGTIDIQDTLSDYDFNAGDTVAIINPLSGVFETLLVTNTTTNGQTALTVTGSIVGTYPAGSPIVRIPRIGGPFSLPGGVVGQIMRHDGTKWTAYGTTALADGVVLTWTDSGGWAAAAPATSGTVTSVGLSLPTSVFDISGSPVTGSGTLTATFDTQAANTVFAGPTTGGAATPAFRALVAADIPATLTGVVGQIAYFGTTTTITTEAGSGVNSLYWDATNNRLAIARASADYTLDVGGTGNFRGPGNTGSSNYGFISTVDTTTTGVNVAFWTNSLNATGNNVVQILTGNTSPPTGGYGIYQADGNKNYFAGNVGVGTTNAGFPLDVVGIARFQGPVYDVFNSPGSSGHILSSTGSAIDWVAPTNQTITLSGDVTGSGTTAITTTIANNAVTVAKMAQLAGLSILGRSANSTGNMAAITASVALSYLRLNAGGTALEWGTLPASGTLTGNGVANRVPYYNGTTSFANIAGFNFDATNFRLQISEQATPDATAATLNVDYGTITGSRAWLDVDGSLSTNLTATIRNFRNVGNSGDNIFSLVTGGASGGDPILQFIISGVETWSIGVDNSDADKLKIKPQASPGAGASGGEGITMTTAVTPLVGINTDAPAHPLDVNGFARALTYTSRTDATGGTVTFGTGAGSGPSLFAVVLPNGNMCTVRWTQGTSGTAGGRVLNIAIPTVLRHASKIYVTFSANNDLTARDIAKFSIDYSGTTPGSIALKSNALLTALDDGGDYFLTMHITGHA
jgi:hypothetical protein